MSAPESLSLLSAEAPGRFNSSRSASQIRNQFSDSTVGFFKGSVSDFMNTGYEFVYKNDKLVSEPELDLWERRPGGNLVVGTSRPLLARLIHGEDLKNIAPGSIREAAGLLHYLNLSQLMHIKMESMRSMTKEGKMAVPELQDFKNQIGDAIAERLVNRSIEVFGIGWDATEKPKVDSSQEAGNPEKSYSKKRSARLSEASIVQTDYTGFTVAEKKFLGSKLIQYIGALTTVKREGYSCGFTEEQSQWFIFCGTSLPDDPSIEPRGVFVIWPTLGMMRHRPIPPTSVYALAGNTSTSNRNAICSWQIFGAFGQTSIHELVRLTLNFKGSAAPVRPTGTGYRLGTGKSNNFADFNETPVADKQLAENDSPYSQETQASPSSANAIEEEEVVPEYAEGAEGEEYAEGAEGEEYAEGEYGEEGAEGAEGYMYPMAYDESVPVYYDAQQATYFYYGNMVWYDPDGEPWSYYYYDWDAQDYAYVDEETQSMLGSGAVTVWDNDSNQYYTPEEWLAYCEMPDGQVVPQDGEEEEEVGAEETEAAEEEEQQTEIKEESKENIKEETKIVADSSETTADQSLETITTETSSLATTTTTIVEDKTTTSPKNDSELVRVAYEAKRPLAPTKKEPERFTGSIDTFNSSESALFGNAMCLLLAIFRSNEELLHVYAQRANGTFKVGRSKKTIEGLINGTMELKALASSSCSDIAATLNDLNLVQLLHIRKNARNSAWDKTPHAAMRTFAMKTDALIAERFCRWLLNLDDESKQGEKINSSKLQTASIVEMANTMTTNELRNMGALAIHVMGSACLLKSSRSKVLGSNPTAASANEKPPGDSLTSEALANLQSVTTPSWWFIPKSPYGGVTCPRSEVTKETVSGMFFNYPEFHAQFDIPEGVTEVFRLTAGRQNMAYFTWDILEINMKQIS